MTIQFIPSISNLMSYEHRHAELMLNKCFINQPIYIDYRISRNLNDIIDVQVVVEFSSCSYQGLYLILQLINIVDYIKKQLQNKSKTERNYFI